MTIVAHLRYDHEGAHVYLKPPDEPPTWTAPLDSFYVAKGDSTWAELRNRALARAQKVAAALGNERPADEAVQL